MRTAITLPELGAPAAVISVWFVAPGDAVYEGDRLVEILAGGATFDVPSPASGRLAQRLALPNDAVRPGQVLGLVEVEEERP